MGEILSVSERKLLNGTSWDDIWAERVSGKTLAAIGLAHGVTRERIRQIISGYAKSTNAEMPKRTQREISDMVLLTAARVSLREIFKGGEFPRDRVLSVFGWESDERSDIELAGWIHATLGISNLGAFRWCWFGPHLVPVGGFCPKSRNICRSCNCKRQKLRHQKLGWRAMDYMPAWKKKVYEKRYLARKAGKPLPSLDRPITPQGRGWTGILANNTPEQVAEIVARRVASFKQTMKDRYGSPKASDEGAPRAGE